MKEQIEKIIIKNVNATPIGRGNSVIGIIPAAQEITDHVFQFIEWAVRKEMLQYSGSAEEWQTTYSGNYFDLEELYIFWNDNVFSKTKKEKL